MSFPLDPQVLAVGSVLVGLSVYFLKKTDRKIDATSEKLDILKEDLSDFKIEMTNKIGDIRGDVKEDMIKIFNASCHERQEACSRLQETKMNALEAREHTICGKIARLEAERREDWGEQRRWNQRWEDRHSEEKEGKK